MVVKNKTPNKYYIHLSGGVGDCLFPYFVGKQLRLSTCGGMGFLYKTKPEDKIKIIAHPSQAGSIKEFFKFDPRINEIQELLWHNPNLKCQKESQESQGYIKLNRYGKENKWIRKPNKKIYTNQEDDRSIEEITNKGPFILLHPFAGEKIRIPFSDKTYPELIDKINNKLNCNVVMVGSSHYRGVHKGKEIVEKCSYESDRFINLINNTNLRVSAKLIQLAKAIVITHSVMFPISAHGDTPGVVIIKDKRWEKFAVEKIRNAFVKKDKMTTLVIEGMTERQKTKEIIKCLHKMI